MALLVKMPGQQSTQLTRSAWNNDAQLPSHSAKGTKPCRQTGEEPVYRGGLGVPVLRVFLRSHKDLLQIVPLADELGVQHDLSIVEFRNRAAFFRGIGEPGKNLFAGAWNLGHQLQMALGNLEAAALLLQ